MANQWFFSWDEHKFGPFSADELKNLAVIGRLQPTDIVWKQGMAAGVVAARVKDLFQVVVSPVGTFVAVAPSPQSVPEPVTEPAQDETQEAISPQTIFEPEPEPAEPEPAEPEPVEPAPEAPSAEELPVDDSAEDIPEVAPRPKPKPPPPERQPQSSAKAIRGVVIIGQDGKSVQFRKKCPKCGEEDNSRSSLPIRNGTMRISFYCRKCRKTHSAEIQGVVK